jgi:hypothetical protein
MRSRIDIFSIFIPCQANLSQAKNAMIFFFELLVLFFLEIIIR